MKIKLLIALFGAFAINLYAGAANLVVSTGGILTGARNVIVDGIYYDVDFKQGSFDQVFCNGVCIDTNTATQAFKFAIALSDQVLIDDVMGSFDSSPFLTFGCTSPYTTCNIYTPFKSDVLDAYSQIFKNSSLPDTYGINQPMLRTIPLSEFPSRVGADWTAAGVSVVPVPQAALFFGSSLLGLTGLARKRKVV
jgi:hypothetical protein